MPDHRRPDGIPRPVMVIWGWPRERYANGVVSYAAEIVAGMRQVGAEPRIAAFRVAQDSQEDFVSRVPAASEMSRRAARLAFAGLRRICPRFVSSRLHHAPLLAEIQRLSNDVGVDVCEIEEAFGWARHIAPRSPIPVVVRLHGPWFLNGAALGVEQDWSFRKRVRDEGRAITAAHGVTAPSLSVLQAVRSFYGLSLTTAEVIPNPVHPVAARERWNLCACAPKQIVFVGRFDRHKGGDVVIDAMAKLRSVQPDCRLTMAGPDTGVMGGSGHRTHLKDYIDARMPGAIEEGSIEWAGHLPPERLADLRRRALVTVVCSRYETFGLTAVEAMALGCPVVASRVGGIPEIIQHERNGLLCRAGNAEDLAEKILMLLRNPELAARLGRQAAIDAEERYHPRIIAQKTLAYYLRVIERFQANRTARRRR